MLMAKRVREFAVKENLADRVVFTGTIHENDRPESLLSMADIFIFPSFYEGFGLPPLEAMACGVPVVAFERDFDTGSRGGRRYLFNPNDVDELTNSMVRLLTDTHLKSHLIARGLERARCFGEEQTAGGLMQLSGPSYGGSAMNILKTGGVDLSR